MTDYNSLVMDCGNIALRAQERGTRNLARFVQQLAQECKQLCEELGEIELHPAISPGG